MTHVLVPVAILEGESVSTGLIELLAPATVTVLGYHELPEQTPTDQARAQFEEQAMDTLKDIRAAFEEAGGTAYHRLVFTHDREKSIDRVAAEIEADAYVIPGASGAIDDLLVGVSGAMPVEPIVEFVSALGSDRDITVTLLWRETDEPESFTLDEAVTRLEEAGVTVTARSESDSLVEVMREGIPGHDAVVMGERAPSLSSLILGEDTERVAAASVGPVLVVRAPSEGAD